VLLTQYCCVVFAQEDADTFFLAKKKGLLGKLGQSIATQPEPQKDTLQDAFKNTSPFILYKGSIIRNLIVSKVIYGQSINDTSAIYKNRLTKIANNLHRNTTEKTIKNNLFFKEGDSVKPFLFADNEAYLRSIPYLQDAKIVIKEVADENLNYDSVDVVILYKDVFPISGTISSDNNRNLYIESKDDNISGHGDHIQLMNLYDMDRTPKFGWGGEYWKRNINGSFIDFIAGYQNIAPAYNSGRREENRMFLNLEMPLVSPHRRITGAVEISYNYTHNNFIPDSVYNSDYKYQYKNFDSWIGFNITSKNNLLESTNRKRKEFISFRILDKTFYSVPSKYLTQYNFQYADLKSVLVSYTLFKQEFYHTSFIYGFGRTEDIPVGYNYAIISGWTNKENSTRPYIGIDLSKNFITDKQNYLNFEFKAGSYVNQCNFQDVSLLASIDAFTRLKKVGKSKWFARNFFNGSVTQQINTVLNPSVYLNSNYGLTDFINPDSTGSSRVTANFQTVFFNTRRYLGFSFAPFTFGGLCYIKPKTKSILQGNFYTRLGVGIRSRNENLIFGTMELKVSYYPVTTLGMSPWNIAFNTDLRFRYNSQFIKRPDFISVN
jgi:hypothetical protein